MRSSKPVSKKLAGVLKASDKHWVGNGFYVHGLLRPNGEHKDLISPFILMDYAPPKSFPKTDVQKGVGLHPHKGFETVTFAYQGEIEHKDSSGGGGTIKAGGVQWMTAGSGIIHEEFHSRDFSQSGGILEMVQLWVNLPKKHKLTKPKYQSIDTKDIPVCSPEKGLVLRVIAGQFEEAKGPADTFTKMNIYDIQSEKEINVDLPFNEGTNTVVLVLDGAIQVEGVEYSKKNILVYERGGSNLKFTALTGFKGLILNGEPIDEPLVAHGPFVMNTEEEIVEAFHEFQSGKMGNF